MTDETPDSLQVNAANAGHLQGSHRWARFLAIIGFAFCGFAVLNGLFIASMATGRGWAGSGLSLLAPYLAFAAASFVPCLYLYRFADKMKQALAMQDQATLDASFLNLKSAFKFVVILIAIVLGSYALFIGLVVLGSGYMVLYP